VTAHTGGEDILFRAEMVVEATCARGQAGGRFDLSHARTAEALLADRRMAASAIRSRVGVDVPARTQVNT